MEVWHGVVDGALPKLTMTVAMKIVCRAIPRVLGGTIRAVLAVVGAVVLVRSAAFGMSMTDTGRHDAAE